MRVDLHCHSTCSDGILDPEVVLTNAIEAGVELFCLTDHDTLAGHERLAAPPSAMIRLLCGLELSCRAFGRTVHLLVYGVRPGRDAALRERLAALQANRRQRIIAICRRLGDLGIMLTPDEVGHAEHGRSAGRPDVARALVRRGVVTSVREAFDRFLRDGGPADVDVQRLDVAEGLRLALDAGARVSLAHPHTLGHPALVEDLFAQHRTAGLEGIEAYYGPYAVAERTPWLRLAHTHGLVVTGGSDFHGDRGAKVARLGVDLPPQYAEALTRWLDV